MTSQLLLLAFDGVRGFSRYFQTGNVDNMAVNCRRITFRNDDNVDILDIPSVLVLLSSPLSLHAAGR